MDSILDNERLEKACNAVIHSLSGYEPEYKIAALHKCIDSFPAEYLIAEKSTGD